MATKPNRKNKKPPKASAKLSSIKREIKQLEKKRKLSKAQKGRLAALKAWATRLEQGWVPKPRTPKAKDVPQKPKTRKKTQRKTHKKSQKKPKSAKGTSNHIVATYTAEEVHEAYSRNPNPETVAKAKKLSAIMNKNSRKKTKRK